MMDPEKKTSYPFNTYSFSSRHIFFNGFPFKEFLNDLTAVLKEMKNPNIFLIILIINLLKTVKFTALIDIFLKKQTP